MAQHTLVVLNTPYPLTIAQAPIMTLNGKQIYVMTDDLLTNIRMQIESSVNAPSSYQTVGFINNGRVQVDDGNELNLDIYDYRQFMYED